jgi:hypothetical protein
MAGLFHKQTVLNVYCNPGFVHIHTEMHFKSLQFTLDLLCLKILSNSNGTSIQKGQRSIMGM